MSAQGFDIRALGGVTDQLLPMLDRQVVLMQELVGLAQREQRHLIAFEAAGLAACVAEKRILAEAIEITGGSIRAVLAPAGATTVAALAEALPAPDREHVMERVVCLRSLGQSLDELHQMTLVQARRGVGFVRGYANLLRGADPATAPSSGGTYTAHGRARPEPISRPTVVRSL